MKTTAIVIPILWGCLHAQAQPTPSIKTDTTGTSQAEQVATKLPALSLDDFLKRAVQQSDQFKSIELSEKALAAEIGSRTANLFTQMTFETWNVTDRKDSYANNVNRQNDARWTGITFDKLFSTGTLASLNASYEMAEQNTFMGSPLYRADWEVSLSQELWRNSFGRGTRLLQDSFQAELKSRQFDLLLQKQQLMSRFENFYWDLAFLYKQQEVQKLNIKRSEQILEWTRKRYNVSAALDTDVLQAQALLAIRKLDLADVENQIEKTWVALQDVMPESAAKSWQPDFNQLTLRRSLNELTLNPSASTPIRLETLILAYRQKQLQATYKSTTDEVRPSLALTFAHGRNGVRDNSGDAISRAGDDQTNYSAVGLVLTVDLDLDENNKRKDSVRFLAEANEALVKRVQRTNQLNWDDLKREVSSLQDQLMLATNLSNFQKTKSEKERRFYQQGRSTVFQAISFELDAAEAELRVYRILNQLRKTENQARFYGLDETAG